MSGILTDSQVDAWGDQSVPAAVPLTGDMLVRDLNGQGRAIINLLNQTPAEIWISRYRTDGQGHGSQLDPYDGSSPAKLTALFTDITKTPAGATIHLGPALSAAPFQMDAAATGLGAAFYCRSGWTIVGAGMYATYVQLIGNMAGQHYDVEAFKTASNVSTDNITIRDLTVDCNYTGLSATADTANLEKQFKSGAVCIYGSNNLVQRTRCINSYGSLANNFERFDFLLGSPSTTATTGNRILDCWAELPAGTYGAPYAIFGMSGFPTRNATVNGCYAYGINNGLNPGYNTGGVNLAYIENATVTDNDFVDCAGLAYQDTGTCNGLRVARNSLLRGTLAFNMAIQGGAPANIQVVDNTIGLQNRNVAGRVYGIIASFGTNASVTTMQVSLNKIYYQNDGGGSNDYCPLSFDAGSSADGVTNTDTSLVSATANFVSGDVGKVVTGSGIPSGTTIASRTNATTVVLSAATTATATGVTFTITGRLNGLVVEHNRMDAPITAGSVSSLSGVKLTNNRTHTGAVVANFQDVDPAKTITAATQTGNKTINQPAGTVRFAAAGQSITLTNSLIATTTKGIAIVQTDDTTAFACKFIAGNGTATLKLNAAATAETEVWWEIRN